MKWLSFVFVFLLSHGAARAEEEGVFDVKKMCADSMRENFLQLNRSSWKFPEVFFSQSPELIAKTFLLRTDSPVIPWQLQDLTHPNVVKAAYLIQLNYAQKLIDRFHNGMSPREVLRLAALKKATYAPETIAHGQEVLDSVLKSEVPADFKLILQNIKGLCAQFLDPKCPAAAAEILKVMDTRWVGNKYIGPCCAGTSHPAILKRIWTDPDLVQGLAIFTGRLMDYISNGKPTPQHLLSDLVSAYRSVGFSLQKSQDLARVILGFYGSRGASVAFFKNSVNAENFPVMVSIYVFSAALGILDMERATANSSYSYPPEMKSACVMGRPYHFWMAAELSQSLLDKGFSKRTVAGVGHLFGKLYEFGAQVVGRDPRKIYTDPFRSPYQVSVQVGLAYKSAAVLWATNQWNERWPLDRGLDRIFSRAHPLPKMTPADLKKKLENPFIRYSMFHWLIAPDEYLRGTGKVPFAENNP